MLFDGVGFAVAVQFLSDDKVTLRHVPGAGAGAGRHRLIQPRKNEGPLLATTYSGVL